MRFGASDVPVKSVRSFKNLQIISVRFIAYCRRACGVEIPLLLMFRLAHVAGPDHPLRDSVGHARVSSLSTDEASKQAPVHMTISSLPVPEDGVCRT